MVAWASAFVCVCLKEVHLPPQFPANLPPASLSPLSTWETLCFPMTQRGLVRISVESHNANLAWISTHRLRIASGMVGNACILKGPKVGNAAFLTHFGASGPFRARSLGPPGPWAVDAAIVADSSGGAGVRRTLRRCLGKFGKRAPRRHILQLSNDVDSPRTLLGSLLSD